jgi:hypothetical protein
LRFREPEVSGLNSQSILSSGMNTMTRYKVAIVLITTLSLLMALPASAQWKWRDKNGRTQYSDVSPPPSVNERDILQRPPGGEGKTTRVIKPVFVAASSASAATPTLAPKTTEPELEAKRKKSEQDAAEKKKAEEAKQVATRAAVRAENCAQAKSYMRSIDGGMRIARTNEKGEREVLDDAARALEAKRTRDVMASECN